ncbi:MULTISPECIES: hypothetical protein [Bacillus amyloliquefaciens group]|uniref:hypothetical protein n=1 Tax=Bacillus amyloliquefaciens group TaxID=1938374 RepID=UPI00073C5E30|nr:MULTISPECIES: hypothetical protein [Bacillus amyloliquefaciens group]KTF59775.1 hypothetical protein AR691_13660 [Bacillus amyloliquefaciens]
MDTSIRVKVMYDDTVYNKWGDIINEVYAGDVIDAFLDKDEEKYFGKDRKCREVFVGYISTYGKLVMEPGFKLVRNK